MTHARSAALLFATVACANCSLFYPLKGIGDGTGEDGSVVDAIGDDEAVEAAPDTNGFDAQGADSTDAPADGALGSSSDGGTTDVGAGDVDANREGAADDGAVRADAKPEGAVADGAGDADATDGAADADGGASQFCASLSPQPLFCDDFDEHPLPGLWTTFNQVGGTLALDTAASVSPPDSLLASDLALQLGQPLDTALRIRFSLPTPTTATPTTIVWDFQIRPAVADTTIAATTVVAALDFIDVSNSRYSVQFAMIQQGASLAIRFEEQSGFIDGGTSYVAHPLPDTMSVGAWTHVRVVIARTAPVTASAVVSFGSVTELNTPLTMTTNGATLQMIIGSSFESEPSLGWKIRYDNVTLNF